MSVEDLAAVGEQLKHFQLAAVGGHHDVIVTFTQELHVQHLVVVTHKLQEVKDTRTLFASVNSTLFIVLFFSGLHQIKTKQMKTRFRSGAYLLQCGEFRQLVEEYVVFCSDHGQPGGGRQEEKIHQTARIVLLVFLRSRSGGRWRGLGVNTASSAGLPHSQHTYRIKSVLNSPRILKLMR